MKNARQQGTQTKQTIESEQPKKVIPDEEFRASDSTLGGYDSVGKRKILKRIWTFFLQNLTGVGTFLLGIAAVLAVIFKVILPNTLQVEGTFTTSEVVSKLVQIEKSTEEIGESIKRVERDPKASVIDRAIVDAYKLQLNGKIKDAIKKWHSIANVVEGSNNDLASGAWFSVGYLQLTAGSDEGLAAGSDEGLAAGSDEGLAAGSDEGLAAGSDEGLAAGSDEETIAAFGKAFDLDPDHAKVLYKRVISKMFVSQYEEAITAFGKALDLKPDYAEAHYGWATAKMFVSQYEEAITAFGKALDLKPDYAEAYYGRGAAKLSLSQYEAAIVDYNEAIRLKREFSGAFANRGEAKSKLDRYKAAIADYDEAIRLDPDYAYAYYIRADAKFALGYIEEGKSDFKTALKLEENVDHKKVKAMAEMRALIDNLREHHLRKRRNLPEK